MDESMEELLTHTSTMGQAKMFSKNWYNEYFKRADKSAAHAHFCREVYGIDLCQHGMMDAAEMDFLASLLRPGETVLEIGCANGRITEYLHDRTGCAILGIDYSDVAISQAQARTETKAPALRFQCVDLIGGEIPDGDYDAIIAIDCIYFMGDYATTIRKLNTRLRPGGRIIVAAFQAREEGDPEDILKPGSTRLAQVLKALSSSCMAYDFTPNVRNHWIRNHAFSRSLRSAFEAEGNGFLAEARMAENGWFKNHAERGTLTRFVYVIDHNPELAP